MAAGRKLTLTILGNAKGAVDALHSTGGAAAKLGSSVGAMGKKLAIGFAAASAGAAALGFLGSRLVKGAEFAKQADDRLDAVAQSMRLFGEQTGAVTSRLKTLADAQEYELGVTAETIKLTQAKLLTFANIAREADVVGGAFDRATVAAVDLAAAGFGAAEQNAVQLGKALQDPIKGITALARSGVTFTDAEKAKIAALVNSNQMLAAQDTLLKAIEAQVGGTAKATTTDTFRISAAFGHVRDEIGTLLLPTVAKFAGFMVDTVVPLATQAGEAFKTGGLAGGIQFLVGKLGEFALVVVEKLREMLPAVVAKLGEMGAAFVGWLVNATPQVIAKLGELANQFAAWVTPMIPKVIAKLQELVPRLVAYIMTTREALLGKLIEWGNAFFAWVTPIIPKLLAKLQEFALAIGNWIISTGLPNLVKQAQRLGDALVSWIGPLLRDLPSRLVSLLAPIARWALGTAVPALVKLGVKLGLSLVRWTLTLGKDLIIGLGKAVVALVAALPSLFMGLFVGLGKIAASAVSVFIDGFKAIQIKLAEIAVGAINFLIDKFNSIPLVPNIDRVTVDFAKLRTSMGLTAQQTASVATTMTSAKPAAIGYGSAIEDLRFKTIGARNETSNLNTALGGGGGDDGGGGGGGAKGAANKAKDAMKTYADALRTVQDKSRAVADAQKSIGKAQTALATATKTVADAQARFNLVVGGFPRTSKEAVAAQKALEDAAKRLRDANYRQEDSVRAVADAERRLADLRAVTADPASVADAERGLTRAKFRVEQANFDVADAERELAELRAKPDANPIEIRKREIALEEAKLAVIDATIGQADAVRKLDDERNRAASAQEIADAERDLARAKVAVQDATDEVSQATVEHGLAQMFLNEVVNGAKEGSERYQEALDALNAAREREVDAIDAVADAIQRERDAVLNLAEAQAKLADAARALNAAQVVKVRREFEAANAPTIFASPVAAPTSGTTYVTIAVDAKPLQNKTELADEIIDALRAYERSNGAVPINVGDGRAVA
jgi:hypothetical protein